MSSIDNETPAPCSTAGKLLYYAGMGVILVVVFGVLFPAPQGSGPRISAKPNAERTARNLREAVLFYQTEQKQFPALPGITAGTDTVIETSAESGLISVLVAMPGNVLVEKLNRLQIAYLSDRSARDATKPGIYRSGNDAQLRDSWGNLYLVYLDTNNDGKIEITYPDGKVEVITTAAAVRSLGPNGVMDRSPGAKNDDILSK